MIQPSAQPEGLQFDIAEPYLVAMTVPDSDIDVMGHANNTAYLKWLEKAAWQHSQYLGLDWPDYQKNDCTLVARHTELNYLKACFAGDKLLLATWISENDGRCSVTRSYQLMRIADKQTVLRGLTKWVSVSLSAGKIKRMPKHYIEAYKTMA